MTLLDEADAPNDRRVRALSGRYLAFVSYALRRPTGHFRNFMRFTREWIEDRGSDDSHGRAVWALGTVVSRSPQVGHRGVASELLQQALPALETFTSPRGWAFALLGLDEYLRALGAISACSNCVARWRIGCSISIDEPATTSGPVSRTSSRIAMPGCRKR